MTLPFSLTPAEDLAVQALIRHGTFTKAAKALNLSPATIRTQIIAARGKVGAENPIRLVVLYLQHINAL